uniref:Mannitol 1-phosphate dehydrogenase n=1 Tax=Ganoderma boninense TaxID=34458 RepID=A0A5K1JZI8_9APHY|nr:Mannitol 1-phosphate dehydrogenase [Ganoderma boninense]
MIFKQVAKLPEVVEHFDWRCVDSSAWLARLPSILPAPFSNITVLHANLDELETIPLILPPTLEHLSRAFTSSFLGVLLPTTSDTIPCPKLQVLGLEAEIGLADFPFSGLEYTAAARKDAGFPLRRFMSHPHTRRQDSDGAGTRARFAESSVPLAALVDAVEHRRARDARVCPFRSLSGGCWDVEQAEKYWELPRGLMSYGRDPDPCCDDLDSA